MAAALRGKAVPRPLAVKTACPASQGPVGKAALLIRGHVWCIWARAARARIESNLYPTGGEALRDRAMGSSLVFLVAGLSPSPPTVFDAGGRNGPIHAGVN